MDILVGIFTPKSYVYYKLYVLHKSNKTTEEKINELCSTFNCLKYRKDWAALKDFFENKIYVKTSYVCQTLSGGNGTVQSMYLDDGIRYEEAKEGNRYFYNVASFMEAREDFEEHTIWSTNNYITGSKKTKKYLEEYIHKNNIKIDDSYRSSNIFHTIVGDTIVESVRGHKIYEFIELPR